MAKVLLVGADVALLEGLAQTLIGFGHEVLFAATVGEVAGALNEDFPAIAISPDGTDAYLTYMNFLQPWQSTNTAPRLFQGVVRLRLPRSREVINVVEIS